MEVLPTTSATTPCTISAMETVFATCRFPKLLVTDNGPAFVSVEFETYLKAHGIQHAKTSPYHPASNGLVERCVQTFKRAMKKMSRPIHSRVSNFLLHYRITPHTSTGHSPAELLMGRSLRSCLDLLLPCQHTKTKVHQSQDRQRAQNTNTQLRSVGITVT